MPTKKPRLTGAEVAEMLREAGVTDGIPPAAMHPGEILVPLPLDLLAELEAAAERRYMRGGAAAVVVEILERHREEIASLI